MIKGIIFDADGTLLNSMQIWKEVGFRYLKSKNIEAKSGLADAVSSMSLTESSMYLKKEYQIKDSVEEITLGILDTVKNFYETDVTLKPGVADFLKEAYEQKIPMIVATANNRSLLEKTFARLGILKFFNRVLTCDELGLNKRNADIYLAAADIIKTSPDTTAVFEDVLHGIKSANSAGFTTIAVEDHSNLCEKDLLCNAADYYIKDFKSITINSIFPKKETHHTKE